MSSPPPTPQPAATEEEEEEEEEERAEDGMDEDDIEWEEEESEDDDSVDEEEGYVDESSRGSVGISAAMSAMVEEEHDAEAWPTCCVCMEPWTSDGAHRFCCIPCGHVYGRSCLEKWLHRCGNTTAKCPQCAQRFGQKHITNLHVSFGLVWDHFCRVQILSQKLEARLAENDKEIQQLKADVQSNEENQRLKAQLAVANNKLERLFVDIRSEVAEEHAKIRAHLEVRIADNNDKLIAQVESQIESRHQSSWEESAQDAAAVVQAEFLSMKEQMKKMADEQNATPVDLLRFMEQSGAKLWESIRSRPPAGGHSHNNDGRLEQP